VANRREADIANDGRGRRNCGLLAYDLPRLWNDRSGAKGVIP
jgi:hypothetical protein